MIQNFFPFWLRYTEKRRVPSSNARSFLSLSSGEQSPQSHLAWRERAVSTSVCESSSIAPGVITVRPSEKRFEDGCWFIQVSTVKPAGEPQTLSLGGGVFSPRPETPRAQG